MESKGDPCVATVAASAGLARESRWKSGPPSDVSDGPPGQELQSGSSTEQHQSAKVEVPSGCHGACFPALGWRCNWSRFLFRGEE